MRTLLAVFLVALGILLGCGGGPTAPNDKGVQSQPTPAPTPYHVTPNPTPRCLITSRC
jgi:hypothetical protein